MRLLVLLSLLGDIMLLPFGVDQPLFRLGPLVITYDSVWLLMSVFTVLLVLYALALLLTMTTTPVGLIEGLTMLLAPLRWLRLPVDAFALMALLALADPHAGRGDRAADQGADRARRRLHARRAA